MFVSYGCPKDDAGSEFALDIGKESFPGKVQPTGGPDRFGKLSLGKVPLKKGQAYGVTVRLTKKVAGAMHLRSLALVREKG